MGVAEMYVVLVREKGMFLVEPVPGVSQKDAIEFALGLAGGYSAGLIPVELPAGTDAAWAAWVEGKEPSGRPYFLFRAFDPTLTEAEVEAQLLAQAEEPLKLNLTTIHRAKDYRPPEREPSVVEFRPER